MGLISVAWRTPHPESLSISDTMCELLKNNNCRRQLDGDRNRVFVVMIRKCLCQSGALFDRLTMSVNGPSKSGSQGS